MKIFKIAALALCLAATTGFYSCNDDDTVRPALGEPVVATEGTTFESLTFKWEPIAGATQYGCRLTNENGQAVDAIVTQATEAYFTDLQPATTYTLEVWAFAAVDGDYATAPAVTLTATTAALSKLGTPEVGITSSNGRATASWEAVEGAEYYVYKITGENDEEFGSGTLYSTTHNITGLASGSYTYSLYAGTTQKGYESKSETAIVDFEIAVYELWRVEGTYSSFSMGSEWPATMVANSDGSYSILAFYGVEGFNLDFTINEDNPDEMFSFLNGEYYSPASGWSVWTVPTGLSYPSDLIAYPWYDYCYMTGDSRSGEVGIGCYSAADKDNVNSYEWGYDVFTWGGVSLTIDDVIGDYNTEFNGFQNDYYTNWNLEVLHYSDYITEIWYEDDETVGIDYLYWEECPVTGKFDSEAMTITIEPQIYGTTFSNGEYYWVASQNDMNTPIVAQIAGNGSITMPDLGIWYAFADGKTACCIWGMFDLTKIPEDALYSRKAAPAQKGALAKVRKASTKPTGPRQQKTRR